MEPNRTTIMLARPTRLDALSQIDWMAQLPILVAGILVLALGTRYLSGLNGASKKSRHGSQTVPMMPYWLPVIGHIPYLALLPDNLFNWARKTYLKGIFSLNLGGTTHNFIFKPSLGATLLGQKPERADSEHISKYLMISNFGFPKAESEKYDVMIKELVASYKYLLSDPGLGSLVGGAADALKDSIGSLISFTESQVDQSYWERSSRAELVVTSDGEQVVEASLLPLIRDFVTMTANPALVGTDFVNNNPGYWENLWTMDRGFVYLATGLPRWTPFPPLTRAHVALRRMLTAASAFESALEKKWNGEDPGPDWRDLDNVGTLIKARMEVYRKYDLSIQARAAIEVALLWAMNANANPLIFWMLNHIYADKEVLQRIRDEVAPYVRAIQPSEDFGIAELPRLETLDHDALATKCPLLKSAYIESLRFDTAIWSLKAIRQDFVLSGRGERDPNADMFFLEKGSYAHIAHDLHHTNPQYYEDPGVWKADRHIRYVPDDDGEKKAQADMGNVRPYGGGHSMCKGRAFAQKEALMFTAAIVSFWDMEAKSGGEWKLPKPKRATGTKTTDEDQRVWIKRRVMPPVKA